MTKQTNTIPANRNALIGGLILIFGGALAFVGQIAPDSWGLGFALLVLLGLGASFILAGLLTREAGWFIPGGILSGIGAGIALVDGGNHGLAAPVIVEALPTSARGTACALCVVEVFSDAVDEGGRFEGRTRADGAGMWQLTLPGGFGGPFLTATATVRRLVNLTALAVVDANHLLETGRS